MRDYEDPVHVPPLALKIFTGGLIAFFILTPFVVDIRHGYIGNVVSHISLGLAAIGIIIGFMFIWRLVIWFIFAFYWYLAAVVGIFLFMMSLAFVADLAEMPNLPDTSAVSPVVNVGIVGCLILGIGTLYLIFRRGGITQQIVPQPIPTTPPITAPQKSILDTAQQLAARKKNLGIDDTKEKS